jgi:hypothetical protein
MRIVATLLDLLLEDVLVQWAREVEVNRYVSRKIEIAVKRAGSVATLDRCRCRKLVHIVRADTGAVETFLDAVALILDLRERKVDFCHNPSDIEAASV